MTIVYEHKGWRIEVAPVQRPDGWSARVEVTGPGSWLSEPGLSLDIHETFESPEAAEEGAIRIARDWIDQYTRS